MRRIARRQVRVGLAWFSEHRGRHHPRARVARSDPATSVQPLATLPFLGAISGAHARSKSASPVCSIKRAAPSVIASGQPYTAVEGVNKYSCRSRPAVHHQRTACCYLPGLSRARPLHNAQAVPAARVPWPLGRCGCRGHTRARTRSRQGPPWPTQRAACASLRWSRCGPRDGQRRQTAPGAAGWPRRRRRIAANHPRPPRPGAEDLASQPRAPTPANAAKANAPSPTREHGAS